MAASARTAQEQRLLILGPTRRDIDFTQELLAASGIECRQCSDITELCREAASGVGAILLGEEATDEIFAAQFGSWLARQPQWSDIPILLLSREEVDSPNITHLLTTLGNVSLLERPMRISAFTSAVRSALRARERQYQVRDYVALRERTEQTLSERTRMLDAITTGTTELIFVKDLEGRLIMGNAALFAVIGPEQTVLGKTDLEFHPKREHALRIIENDARIMRSGRTEVIEEEFLSPEGVITFLSTKSPYRDDDGRVIGIIGIARDITERKRLEQSLIDSDRRKDEFLATLAHELRNPLAPILNAAQLLDLAKPTESTVRWARDVLERQVRQLTRLVDDLLDISRISRGKVRLRRERIDLATVLRSAIETSRPQMIAARHELTVDLPRDPIELDADPARLAQVFGNLLNNAAKYSPPQSRIVVSAAHEGDEAVIRVRDSGFGIPAEMLPRIFEMFVQVDHGLERSHGGLGIGLTLVRRFVEMHGGTVTAKSAGHNRGSEFTVRLPLPQAADAAVTISAPAEEEQEPAAVVHRILIVEDNIDGAESLRQLLQSAGHEVRWTDNGIDAIDLVTTFKPDVVLMDIGLPRLNGFEAARRIRQLDGGKNIALIALTGWGQAEHRRRSREVGFDVHFVKPLDFTRLQDTLRALEQRVSGNGRTPAAGNHA